MSTEKSSISEKTLRSSKLGAAVSHCCPENDTAVLAKAAETEQMSSREVSGRLMLTGRTIEFSSLQWAENFSRI
jgi:hypothetical protein